MITSVPTRHPAKRACLAASALLVLLLGASAASAAAQTPAHAGCVSGWGDGTGLVWVFFCSDQDGPGDLYEREPDGDVRRLTDIGRVIGAASISPDGSTIVFQATDTEGNQAQVWSVGRDGMEPRQLTSEGVNSDPVVDPSGDGIVFVSDRSGTPTLWSMTIDGSQQRPLFLASIE